jgi:DNA-binding transcriptional regulator of glucitol operon
VRRVLLAPRWVLGHVVVLVLAVVFCRLGWWQYSRFRITHGDLQNLSYAVQWPVFAAFGIAMWVRILRDAVRPPELQRRATGPKLLPAEPDATPQPEPTPGPPVVEDDEPDDAHAAYNRYLASLYERDRQEQT